MRNTLLIELIIEQGSFMGREILLPVAPFAGGETKTETFLRVCVKHKSTELIRIPEVSIPIPSCPIYIYIYTQLCIYVYTYNRMYIYIYTGYW